MKKSICGVDCNQCEQNNTCNGCTKTNGHPFGPECLVASCLKDGEHVLLEFKKKLITALHALKIPDMEDITELFALKGSTINIEYPLPNGQMIRFWDDNKIYLGNQLRKKNSDRYYGVAADGQYLMVSEYSGYGTDAVVVVFKRCR